MKLRANTAQIIADCRLSATKHQTPAGDILWGRVFKEVAEKWDVTTTTIRNYWKKHGGEA